MANQQGTGKHPHKSAAEPHPHTKDGGKAEEQKGATSGARGQEEQPEESKGAKSGEAKSGEAKGGDAKGAQAKGAQAKNGGGQDGGDDLKAREYTDAAGNVHHHTRAYMEQHKNDAK